MLHKSLSVNLLAETWRRICQSLYLVTKASFNQVFCWIFFQFLCLLAFTAFITGLLNNIGTHVDPILLIHRIKEGMEIPNLRDSLVKILQDYNLQVNVAVFLWHWFSERQQDRLAIEQHKKWLSWRFVHSVQTSVDTVGCYKTRTERVEIC